MNATGADWADRADAARAAWRRYLEADDVAAPDRHEEYVAAAAALVAELAPLVEVMAEANLFAVACEDGTGRFLRLAVEAATEAAAQLVLLTGLVVGRSEQLPALDDVSGRPVELALLLSPGTGAAIERLAAIEAALRADGDRVRADNLRAARELLAAEVDAHDG